MVKAKAEEAKKLLDELDVILQSYDTEIEIAGGGCDETKRQTLDWAVQAIERAMDLNSTHIEFKQLRDVRRMFPSGAVKPVLASGGLTTLVLTVTYNSFEMKRKLGRGHLDEQEG